MNRYVKDMLARRMRDGRNPYGSAGGYITRNKPRRDRNMKNEDYARLGGGHLSNAMDYNNVGYGMGGGYDYAEHNYQQNSNDYAGYDYEGGNRDYEQSGRDYEYMNAGKTYYPIEAMGTFNGYWGGQDYGEMPYKLSHKDIKKWEKELENADGTKGKKWDADQIRQVAQQYSIRFEEYSPELLTAITNMLYSDYCKVLGADMGTYVRLAKAWLEDDDFDGTPEEKAMLYYKCIVSKDD